MKSFSIFCACRPLETNSFQKVHPNGSIGNQAAVLFLDGSNQCDVMMSRLLRSPEDCAAFSFQDGDKRSWDGAENGGERGGWRQFITGLHYPGLTLGGAHDLKSADDQESEPIIKQFGVKKLGNMTSWFIWSFIFFQGRQCYTTQSVTQEMALFLSESTKNSLQATVSAATRTTNSWKSTWPSWFSSRSFMILSTTMGSLDD